MTEQKIAIAGTSSTLPPLRRSIPLLLILFGVGLRLAGYFSNRSLWGDEAAIALNLRFRSFWGLLHPLDYDQTMPIPLLLGLKSLGHLLGFSEYVFRLPQLVIGCLLLAITWLVFSRFFSRKVALIGIGLMAICRPLIYYSSELKQYEWDAFVTVITLWLGLKTLESAEDAGWTRLILWGAVAILVSQPSVFVLAAVGVAAAIDRRFRTSLRWRINCVIAAAVWLVGFTGLFWISYRPVSRSAYMRAFWLSSFLHPLSPNFPHQLSNAIYDLLGGQSFNHLPASVLALIFAIGVYGIARNSSISRVIMATGPFVAVISAAAFSQYPIAARLVLFSTPLLFWIYASGVVTVADFFPQKTRTAVVIALSIGLFGLTAIGTIKYAAHFPPRETTRQMVVQMKSTDPVAPVYFVFGKYLQWAYYAGDWTHPDLLKQKIDFAYRCDRAMQLAYTGRFPKDKCSDLSSSLAPVGQEEIIGHPAPGPTEGVQKDDEWASIEARRIMSRNESHVWLFLPIYNDNQFNGYPKERHLLEKLQSELEKGGARLSNRYELGDSMGLRYEVHSNAQKTEVKLDDFGGGKDLFGFTRHWSVFAGALQ